MSERQTLIVDLRECASDPGTKPQTYLGDMCSRAADALGGPTLEDAYAEGRADEREALADPLHANAVYRVKKQADADGLDIVGFAWRLQKEWLRAPTGEKP
jgi:hypothetical protein